MKIQELLSEESKWLQGTLARDAFGHSVLPNSPCAVRWCLLGAIEHCYAEEAVQTIRRMQDYLNRSRLADWNDEKKRTFRDVRNLVESLDL